MANTTTHKLPTEGVTVSMGGTPLTPSDATDGFTYSAGTITIGSSVTITGPVVITAAAVEKSTKVDLTSLT